MLLLVLIAVAWLAFVAVLLAACRAAAFADDARVSAGEGQRRPQTAEAPSLAARRPERSHSRSLQAST
jgi:hypothetical protein